MAGAAGTGGVFSGSTCSARAVLTVPRANKSTCKTAVERLTSCFSVFATCVAAKGRRPVWRLAAGWALTAPACRGAWQPHRRALPHGSPAAGDAALPSRAPGRAPAFPSNAFMAAGRRQIPLNFERKSTIVRSWGTADEDAEQTRLGRGAHCEGAPLAEGAFAQAPAGAGQPQMGRSGWAARARHHSLRRAYAARDESAGHVRAGGTLRAWPKSRPGFGRPAPGRGPSAEPARLPS